MAQVDIKVIQIASFIGEPEKSPFAAVVATGDTTVCENKIMKAAIDFKWQRLRFWVFLELAYYTVSLFVASTAMIGFAWTTRNVAKADGLNSTTRTLDTVVDDDDDDNTTMFCIVIVLEVLLLVYEMAQLYVLRDLWFNLYNCMNIMSISLLLACACDSLTANESTVLLEHAGSAGLGLKWLGLLSYVDSFQCKSPLPSVLYFPL